ncbi:MAG: hypothetical protein QOD77_707 [Thermoplasmata archaeon]|jgi:hypothetical protein|nr:hypothetical protein [Thermoplasmata archaeon]
MERHEPLAGDTSRPRPLFLALAVMLALAPFVVADPITITLAPTQCSDQVDNDGDRNTDFPLDLGCTDPLDNDESSEGTPPTPECSDGKDNDGNYVADWPNDAGCRTPLDQDESFDPILPCGVQIALTFNGAGDSPDSEQTPPATSPLCILPTQGQCSDGADNDEDGRADWPSDPMCTGPADDYEGGEPQCSDNKDNDADYMKDMSDPDCDSPEDDSEDPVPQCRDGLDNDADGDFDYPMDGGCEHPDDGSEDPQFECSDRKDNDGDGKVDGADTGCDGPEDNTENPNPRCSDGLDNDRDGRTDYPADPECSDERTDDEGPSPECVDGMDNDVNGKFDYPDDAGCSGPTDDDESGPACSDGTDNDRDGKTDYPADPGCDSALDDAENPDPQCGDGIDNDGDRRVDYPDDPGCDDAHDETEDPDSDVVPAGGSFSKSSPSGPISFTPDSGARCDVTSTSTDIYITCHAAGSAICANPGFVAYSSNGGGMSVTGKCDTSRTLTATSPSGSNYDYQGGNFRFPFTCHGHYDAGATGYGTCHAPDP